MSVLVGDMKRRGKLYSMVRELICPGTMENIFVKEQHNTWSERQSYSGNFVPIVHEYIMVTRKDAGILIPVSWGSSKEYDMRQFGGQMSLQELYETLKDSARAKRNAHWQEIIRQTVQNVKSFIRTERETYALAPAA